MKIAVGNDIVHVPGFKKSLNPDFKARVFSAKEIEQIEEYRFDPAVRYATTWAAKEAVIKALKQLKNDYAGLKWKDIQIVRVKKIPIVKIARLEFERLSFSLSLSHDGDYAFATAVICAD